MQRILLTLRHAVPSTVGMPALVLAATLALTACNRGKEAAAANSASNADSGAQMKMLPADFDPCSFISVADVQRLIGPVQGAPTRGFKADQPEPNKKGHACVFTLAPRAGESPVGVLAAELVTEDAVIPETASHMVTEGVSKQTGIDMSIGAKNANGWDYDGALPDMYAGRLGHIAIHIAVHHEDGYDRVPHDSVAKLAAVMRDRIPDLPIASPHKQHSSDGVNSCTLLTQQEAESVLGKLTVPPYRSVDASALAEPNGAGCSYYLGHHRVFTIQAEREIGKQAFQMAARMSNQITSKIGATGSSADTLEGAWDQAGSSSDGSLLFLKGNKLLTVVYRTANVDVAGATKLAALAIKRL